jgi:hypothetical protein
MQDPPNYGQPFPNPDWERSGNSPKASTNVDYLVGNLVERVEQLEQQLVQLRSQNQQLLRRTPNLGVRIFLYCAAFLMVVMAVLLLLYASGASDRIPWISSPTAIGALVLLAIGAGILTAMRNR